MGSWSVEDAVEELSRGLRASPPGLGGDRCGQEWRVLRDIAGARGFLEGFHAEEWKSPVRGREHQCVYNQEQGAWYKVTHKNSAGYSYDFEDQRLYPASPLEYLRRLQLFNDLLCPRVELCALLQGPNHDLRIKTRQAHVVGEAPSLSDIIDFFSAATVHRKIEAGSYGSIALQVGEYWLFDVCPKNFVKTEEGVVYAVDVIVQKEDDETLRLATKTSPPVIDEDDIAD